MSNYAGGKSRYAKEILNVIRQYKEPEQTYVEPFAGGLNVIKHVLGCRRIAGELNPYVVALYKAIASGWIPKLYITREEYRHVRDNKEDYPPEYVGYIGTDLSYSGVWFGGWTSLGAPDTKKGSQRRTYNGWVGDRPFIKSIEFYNCDYRELPIPPNSFIYCDPPYKGTVMLRMYYGDRFDSEAFWNWCRAKIEEGHTLLISENEAPEDFNNVYTLATFGPLTKDSRKRERTEKLFMHRTQV